MRDKGKGGQANEKKLNDEEGCYWSGFNFFRHVGAMAWRRWRMKLPNGFAIFRQSSATALLLHNTLPQLSPPLTTATTVVVFATITVIVLLAVAVAVTAVVLVLLPPPPLPRLLLWLLVDC